MRLVMMCTGPFGVPTFRALCEKKVHPMVALMTAPPRLHRGRGQAPGDAVREAAAEYDVPIFDLEDVNTDAAREQLRSLQTDLLVVCDYGQILSKETLATARLGGINLHASLLPKYRGAAPINWAIYHGETETGVSVIHMTPQLDAGPVIAQQQTPIAPEETAEHLEDRLAEVGAQIIPTSVDALAAGPVEAIPQDASLVSKAPRLKKTDGLLDWSRPAFALQNQIRAFQPWPNAYTFWHRPNGTPLRVILENVEVVETPRPLIDQDASNESKEPPCKPGIVLEATKTELVIGTSQAALSLKTIQPAGKRKLTAEEFLRGYPVQVGESFGPEQMD